MYFRISNNNSWFFTYIRFHTFLVAVLFGNSLGIQHALPYSDEVSTLLEAPWKATISVYGCCQGFMNGTYCPTHASPQSLRTGIIHADTTQKTRTQSRGASTVNRTLVLYLLAFNPRLPLIRIEQEAYMVCRSPCFT